MELPRGEEYQLFGDGLFAGNGSIAQVESTIVTDSARTGAYYYEASGTMSGSVIKGNGSYGLAMGSCEANVTYKDNGNYIFGNALDMPAGEAAQVTTNPKGLPLPPTPEVSAVLLEPLGER